MSQIKLSKLEVLGNRIAVKKTEGEKESSGGILLPSSSNEEQIVGKVLKIGTGETKDGVVTPIESVQKGDHVIFQKWGGTKLLTDEGEILLVDLKDVIAKMS